MYSRSEEILVTIPPPLSNYSPLLFTISAEGRENFGFFVYYFYYFLLLYF